MSKDLLLFVRDPFTNTSHIYFFTSLHLDEGSLQLEIIGMQLSSNLMHALENEGFTKFWSKCIDVEKFPNTHMNTIKTSARAFLTNKRLHHCLRNALT